MLGNGGSWMKRLAAMLTCATLVGCSDPTDPLADVVTIEATSVTRQDNGQWLVTFNVMNRGASEVFLPYCGYVLTGLERWTDSDWSRVPVEACSWNPGDPLYSLASGSGIEGRRALVASGRYRLHVRYTNTDDGSLDRQATTGRIDIP